MLGVSQPRKPQATLLLLSNNIEQRCGCIYAACKSVTCRPSSRRETGVWSGLRYVVWKKKQARLKHRDCGARQLALEKQMLCIFNHSHLLVTLLCPGPALQ